MGSRSALDPLRMLELIVRDSSTGTTTSIMAPRTLQLQRREILQHSYDAHPLRFKGCIPQPHALPTVA